jgi:hypothetical protein
MLQQINLYEPIFREEHKLFSANTICGGLGIVAAGLLAIALFSWWRLILLDRLTHSVQSQVAAQKRFIEHANSLVDLGESPQTIEIRLKSITIDLERRRQALRYLIGGEAGGRAAPSEAVGAADNGNRGFAGRMAALARQQLDGLWLTGATFTADSGRFELTGSATGAELVPIYLGRLASEAALAGIPLQSIEIRQPKNPTRGEIEFAVSSATSAESKDSALTLTSTAAQSKDSAPASPSTARNTP